MKRWLSILLALALLATAPFAAVAEQKVDLTGKLVIVHTNDIHGRAQTDLAEPSVGYAQIKQYREDAKALGASVLLLDAGDASQGEPIVNLEKGANAFQFMNWAGYDAMCPGNHEFDWGVDQFLQNAGTAEFPVLCANLLRTSDKTLYFEPYKIFDEGEYKVGVIGLDTPETLTKTNPSLMNNVTFLMGEDLYASTQKYVDELKAAGCNLIVVLGHLGVEEESTGNRSLDLIANTTGIDLFIDGHSHVVLNEAVQQKHEDGAENVPTTLLVSTGCYGHNIGEVVFDGKKLSASLYAAQPTQVSAEYGDADVSAQIGAIGDQIDKELSTAFAKTEVLLDGNKAPGVRTQETNLGDFCTDAMLWQANQVYFEPVVAAFNNGGGIRASIQIGDVTMKDMKTVFPFGNTLQIMTLKGSELLELIEASTFCTPEPIGGFLQVSGVVFTVDTTVPYENGEQYPNSTYYAPAKPGSRVTIATVGGEAFDPEKDYVVVTNDFSAAGGDQSYVLKYANQQTGFNTYVALEDALIDYTRDVLGGVIGQQYAQPQGRITIIQ
ncbi:MAG TPA: bifunctional UDP-sugar hydrolase/5'-nucleotidase [Candidatus Limiplasma sp.]|nr:bifunctional UDP-sugar hydrolase/5'-nucleotidase [Candidatus Limiplasma sp.]HPS80751.1 bifunctional UDP-sugar hydrolase/5'-nucleotidase [Candidatus Limiplasma sp.]